MSKDLVEGDENEVALHSISVAMIFGSAATSKFRACVRALTFFCERVLFSRHCIGIDDAMAHISGHF